MSLDEREPSRGSTGWDNEHRRDFFPEVDELAGNVGMIAQSI